jgi:hypothetical protein
LHAEADLDEDAVAGSETFTVRVKASWSATNVAGSAFTWTSCSRSWSTVSAWLASSSSSLAIPMHPARRVKAASKPTTCSARIVPDRRGVVLKVPGHASVNPPG